MDENFLAVIGVGVILISLGAALKQMSQEGYTLKTGWRLFAILLGMLALVVWIGLLPLYGIIGVGWVGYLVGRAILNQADKDIRPEQSENRKRLYTTVQIVVVVGIIWLVGWVAFRDAYWFRSLLEEDY